ncbi:MAG: hypothetical protein ABI457_13175, partial [Hyphomicrobium sp.]
HFECGAFSHSATSPNPSNGRRAAVDAARTRKFGTVLIRETLRPDKGMEAGVAAGKGAGRRR